MESNDKIFLSNLLELSEGLYWSGFARKCGIKQTTMNGYLSGKYEPTVTNLCKIAAACDVRVGWLAAGELPKELQREVLNDTASIDLVAEVGRIMEEKEIDQVPRVSRFFRMMFFSGKLSTIVHVFFGSLFTPTHSTA